MFTIIQDYKNYRQQKKNLKLLKNEYAIRFKNMVQPISLSELDDYKRQLELLTIGGKAVYSEKDIQALEKYMHEKAPLVHLPSCFCTVFASSYLIPTNIIESIIFSDFAKKERSELKEEKVVKCIHSEADGGIIHENYCANCSEDTFKNLLEYHSLKSQLQDAQQALKEAKQELLNNLGLSNKNNKR